MAGRGDKGLLITTGTFTREARVEATRDGAPPIDLIDGEQLCELLKQHQLGVRTEELRVEDVKIVASFFEELGQFPSSSASVARSIHGGVKLWPSR